MAAIESALRAIVPPPTVLRSAPRSFAVPRLGLVIFDMQSEDDEGVAPDETLLGLGQGPVYQWEYAVPIEVMTQEGPGHRPHDDLVDAVLGAVRADPSFGGLLTWSEPYRPSYQSDSGEGIATIESSEIRLFVVYDTANLAD